MIYNPMDCEDTDAPLGMPTPHTPDETSGALIWLGVALILGGLVLWWVTR